MIEDKNEHLLVVLLYPPSDQRRCEIYRAIFLQLYEIFGHNMTVLDFDEEYDLYKYLSGDTVLIKDGSWYCDGYKELKERHQEILECVDNVLIFGAQTNGCDDRYTRALPKMYNIDTIKLELDKCHRKDDYGFVNVGTRKKLKNVLSRMVFLEQLGESDVNVFHYAVDPREPDFSLIIGKDRYKRLGALKSTLGPSKPIPFFEWGLNETYIQELGKYNDFYYAGSVILPSRFYLRDVRKRFNKYLTKTKPEKDGYRNPLRGSFEVFYDNKNGKEKDVTVLSQDKYYYKLCISRYTYINPPFKSDEFNYTRFIEAIILNCIPLVDTKMNLDDLQLTYPEFYDIIIENKLFIDTDKTSYMSIATRMRNYKENGDSELIDKFKSTKAYQALMDVDKIRECWRKKLRWKDV